MCPAPASAPKARDPKKVAAKIRAWVKKGRGASKLGLPAWCDPHAPILPLVTELEEAILQARIGRKVQELADAGAIFVVSNSGGKDSQAMLIEVARRVPANQILSLHADLGEDGRDAEGVEWPDTEKWVAYMSEDLGIEWAVCKAGKGFFDMVRRSADRLREQGKYEGASPWPSPKYRQCTSDLKRGPIHKAIRAYVKERGIKDAIVVDCVGLRAEESPGRAKAHPWGYDKKLSTPKGAVRHWYSWLPVHRHLTGKVFRTISEAGQVPHWAYRSGMERLSCCFCIMASKDDLVAAAALRPGLYAHYVAMEKELGKTLLMSGETLEETTGIKARHLPVLNGAA